MRRYLATLAVLVVSAAAASCSFTPFSQIPFTVSLGAPVSVETGESPSSLASGDFNGDGHVDLVVNYFIDHHLQVFLGDGTGAFEAGEAFEVLPRPAGILSASFNGDGLTDLVVLLDTSHQVALYAGDAAAGLARVETLALPTEPGTPSSVGYGDFDGNGRLDVVVSYRDATTGALAFGALTGGFTAPVLVDFEVHAGRFAVDDVNGDGLDDLYVLGEIEGMAGNPTRAGAVARPADHPDDAGGELVLFVSDGDGFGPSQSIARSLHNRFGRVALGDVTGNGRMDPVYSEFNNALGIVPHTDAGAFGEPIKYVVNNVSGIALADLDRDGDLDVITSRTRGQVEPGKVHVLLNAGGGELRAPEPFETRFGPAGLLSDDFDGDGYPDIAVVNFFNGEIQVWMNETGP